MAKAKKKKNDFSCLGCGVNFGGPIALSKHYGKVSDAHLVRALTKRYGGVRPSVWHRYRDYAPPGGKQSRAVATSLPTVRKSSAAKTEKSLRFCTACGTRKGASWAFCGHCGSRVTGRR
jgi:hypothetical protein